LEQKYQIGFVPAPVDEKLFDVFFIRSEKIYIIAGKGHRLGNRKSVPLSELENEKIVSSFYTHNTGLAERYRQYNVNFDTQINYYDTALLAELCRGNRFLSFCAGPFETGEDLTRLEIEDGDFLTDLYMIVNKRAFINKAADTFVKYAKKRLRTEARRGCG
jgi:hypothetical protein